MKKVSYGDPTSGYSQAVEVRGERRTLYISGQIPAEPSSDIPADFETQCTNALANVSASYCQMRCTAS